MKFVICLASFMPYLIKLTQAGILRKFHETSYCLLQIFPKQSFSILQIRESAQQTFFMIIFKILTCITYPNF